MACKNQAFVKKQRISVVGLGTGPQCLFVTVRVYNQPTHNALKRCISGRKTRKLDCRLIEAAQIELPDPSPGKPGPTPRSASHYTGGYMRRIGSGGVRPAGAASGRALAGNPLLRRFSERLLFPAPDTQHVSGEWHTSVLQAYEYPDGTCPALE